MDVAVIPSGGGALSQWLASVPSPEWTVRPTAKDDLRDGPLRCVPAAPRTARSWKALGVSKNNPTTVRKNVGAGEHDCLAVYVRRGRELLLQVT